MKTYRSAKTMIGLVFLAGLLMPAPSVALAASTTTFSGQATVVKGTVAGIAVGPLADTGAIAPSGGASEKAVFVYPIDKAFHPPRGARPAQAPPPTPLAGGG